MASDEIEIVSGGSGNIMGGATAWGGGIGGLIGLGVTNTMNGFARGGAFGAAIGASFSVGYAIGTAIYSVGSSLYYG